MSMGLKSGLAFAWKNYGYPLIYAVGGAVLAYAAQTLTGGNPLSVHGLEAVALTAAVAFLGPRLNPTAGKKEPFVEPHVDP